MAYNAKKNLQNRKNNSNLLLKAKPFLSEFEEIMIELSTRDINHISKEKSNNLSESLKDVELNNAQTIKKDIKKLSNNNPKNLYKGHRLRLRKKILNLEYSALAEYELLEALLGFAQRRKDTKPLAKILLSSFRGINGVISAESADLMRIEGVGETIATMLKLMHAIMIKALREEAKSRPCLDNIDKVIEYCKIYIGHLTKEVNLVLFLDVKNFLIETELKTLGTVDQVHTYPREIISKTLELKAKSIIMVHNHPSGDSTPSKEDIETTKHVLVLAEMMDIILHDHIIVSSNGIYSMRSNGDI